MNLLISSLGRSSYFFSWRCPFLNCECSCEMKLDYWDTYLISSLLSYIDQRSRKWLRLPCPVLCHPVVMPLVNFLGRGVRGSLPSPLCITPHPLIKEAHVSFSFEKMNNLWSWNDFDKVWILLLHEKDTSWILREKKRGAGKLSERKIER